MKLRWKEIKKLTQEENKSVDRSFVKLTEELGEMSVAHQRLIGNKKSKQGKEYDRENLLEEAIDSIQIIISIVISYGFTYKEFLKMFKKKNKKWKKIL